MTLPTSYGWYPIGQTQHIPHEAPQGRRVNAIGASCSHGPQAGGFMFATYASVPKSTAKKARKTIEERAATHQVDAACLGPIDGERLVAFFWQLSGRPLVHTADWRRERRLIIVLDNYSVHKGDAVKGAKSLDEAKVAGADIIKEARAQAAKIADQAGRRSNEMIEEAKTAAVAEGQRLLGDAKAEVALESNRARAQLSKEVATLAVSGASKLLGREIDAKAHADLLDKLALEIERG